MKILANLIEHPGFRDLWGGRETKKGKKKRLVDKNLQYNNVEGSMSWREKSELKEKRSKNKASIESFG